LSGQENRFTKEDLHVLQLFSPLASLALRNTHLYSNVKEALQEQDMFISMAAHELKTPLTAISIYAQLVLQENSEKKFATIHVKEKMFHEIQRLSKLVNELLQVSQIKKGRLQYSMKKCDIVKVAEHIVSSFQTIDTKHKIRLQIDSSIKSCHIKGDQDKMTQVISNLLTNAAKFSPEGKTIDVILKKQKDCVSIIVRDHGIGMTDEQMSHIFEGFYKAAIKTKEGLGLGLFLVKNIVDSHRGTITVKSKPQQGTNFTITLPLYA
jgi:signal transduction histidine kinase